MNRTQPKDLPGAREFVIPCYPPCVYFVTVASDVVYVGQTTDLVSRLRAGTGHPAMYLQPRARVFFIACAPEDLNRVEAAFIRFYEPPLNGHCKSGAFCTPQPDASADAAVLASYGLKPAARAFPATYDLPTQRARRHNAQPKQVRGTHSAGAEAIRRRVNARRTRLSTEKVK